MQWFDFQHTDLESKDFWLLRPVPHDQNLKFLQYQKVFKSLKTQQPHISPTCQYRLVFFSLVSTTRVFLCLMSLNTWGQPFKATDSGQKR